MKTLQSILSGLAQQDSIPHNAAAAALGALIPVWERELANGEKTVNLLSDIDSVIALLLRVQQEAGQMLFTDVPTPALQQKDKFNAGNDYKLDPQSGNASVWIEMGSIIAHLSHVGHQVTVGLHANHELCTDEPLESCVLSQTSARSFIRQTIRESKAST